MLLLTWSLQDHSLEFREKTKQSPGAEKIPGHEGFENKAFLFELRSIHFGKFKCQATLLNSQDSSPAAAESVICFGERKVLPANLPPWAIGSFLWGMTHSDKVTGADVAGAECFERTKRTHGLSTLLKDHMSFSFVVLPTESTSEMPTFEIDEAEVSSIRTERDAFIRTERDAFFEQKRVELTTHRGRNRSWHLVFIRANNITEHGVFSQIYV